jgi:hypothetical protein
MYSGFTRGRWCLCEMFFPHSIDQRTWHWQQWLILNQTNRSRGRQSQRRQPLRRATTGSSLPL